MVRIKNKRLSLLNSSKFLETLSSFFVYVFLTILSILWLVPIFWLVIQSFRAEPGSVQVNFFPQNYTLQNYINLFDPTALAQTSINFPQWFLNTLIIATVTMVVSTIMVLLTSYAFSRLRFGARLPMMQLILILGLFPGFMSMIAVFNILKLLNLTGNIWGLIFIYSGGAGFGYYIAKGYFDTISKAIDEAAMIDGASRSQIFWHIILPLSKPIVIFTALTSFIGPWGDYIFARVILLDNTDSYNVAVGLVWITQRENITQYFTTFLAGSVLVALPITLLFIFMQKYYIEGVTGGSVKG
jgi:arabinogalactan oligomer/maltooligosaccharide transport system permease protein